MFVDRQVYFSYLKSLKLILSTHEILRFQAANISKFKKNSNIFSKKSELRDVFLMIYHQRHVNGDGGCHAVSGANE